MGVLGSHSGVAEHDSKDLVGADPQAILLIMHMGAQG
jgi:hypothetical protein